MFGDSSDFALYYSMPSLDLDWRAELERFLEYRWQKADLVPEDYDCFALNGDYIKFPFDMCKPRSDEGLVESQFPLRFMRTKQNTRKETEDRSDVTDYRSFILPQIPKVVDVASWKIQIGNNCTSCSPFHDRKELIWAYRCQQEDFTYEKLEKPGKRYLILDRTMSLRCDKAVEGIPFLRQQFADELRKAGEKMTTLSGRQKIRMILDYLRTDTTLELVYGVKDFLSLIHI